MTERLHFHFSLSCFGEGNGNPLQCSCLENPRDGGAWWGAVYGVTQSQTRLKWLSSSSLIWGSAPWLRNGVIVSVRLSWKYLVPSLTLFRILFWPCATWDLRSLPLCMLNHLSNAVWPYRLQLTRLLCLWDSPGKNTGVGCHALLQGIFPTQGLNLCLLHCRQILLTAEPPGKPLVPWSGIRPVPLQWKYGVLTPDFQGIPCWRFFISNTE